MKNRIFAFVLITAVLMTTLIAPINISAGTIEPVFTLDLSEYSTDSQVVKNGVDSSSGGISVVNVTDDVAPTIKKYYSVSGEEVYGFQTSTEDDTGTKLGIIKIDAETVNEFLGENGDKEMTVTFWSKPYRNHNGSVFNYNQGKTSSISSFCMKNYDEIAIAGGKAKTSVGSLPLNEWRFHAISKKWTESETTSGSGTWSYSILYGDTVKAGTTDEIAYTDASSMDMFIGAMNTDFEAAGNYLFQGEIAGLNVYNSALTEDELKSIKAEQDYTNLTEPDDMPQTFEVEQTYYKVDPKAGTLKVTFNNFIDPDSVGEIKFYDGDGIDITDYCTFTVQGKQIVVDYCALADGALNTLIIPGGISSTNDIIIEEDIEITIKSVEETDLAVLDLMDDKIGEGPNDKDFIFDSSGTVGDLSDYTVMEEDGVRFIRMRHKGWGSTGNYSDSFLIYDFGKSQEDNFVVDLKIRRGDTPTNATSRLFALNKKTSAALQVHNMHANNIGDPAADGLGFISMRYTFENQGGNKWKVSLFDKYANAAHGKESEKTMTVDGGLKQVAMVLWIQATTDNAVQYTDIAEFRVFPYTFAKATGDDLNYLTEDDDEISVVFDKKMNAETIGDDTFTLTDITDEDNKKVVSTTFESYDPAYKKATIKLGEYLTDGHTYEITVKGAECSYGFPADEESSVVFTTDFSGTEAAIDFADDNASATVTVSNIQSGATVRAYLLLIDDKGRAVEVQKKSLTSNGKMVCELENVPEKDYVLKCFVWESVGDGGNKVITSMATTVAQ